MPHLFCFGLGFSARVFARDRAGRGWQVTATSTSAAGVERIRAAGYGALHYDGRTPGQGVAAALADATHVLVSPAPDAAGDPVLRHHAADLAGAPALGWIGYLSTIGVYGNSDGNWIDETAELRPNSDRSRWRAAAEAAWLDLARSSRKPVQVFRLAGIYGPGRSAIDNLREGSARRIIKPGQVFNRIHVDDIAGALAAAVDRGGRHAIYNVCDDEPAPPQDVVAYAARLLGLPVPPDLPFEQAELSPMARSFYADNKRVSNARLKADLGYAFRHPTYREGMAAIAAGEAIRA
jgi:nucleoside-diphosphate-sugar epimerase